MNLQKFNHIPDSELLENFYADKNNEWLGILMERYTLLLLGVCMKYMKNEDEARDCVQQVFLKSITELHKYKVSYFKSWLYMIARNHCLMKLRSQPLKRTAELTDQHTSIVNEWMFDNKRVEDKEQLYNLLQECMQQLSKEQHQCIVLFYLEKKSYQQIADRTQFTLLQVKSFIQNGKRNLKLMIEKKFSGNPYEV